MLMIERMLGAVRLNANTFEDVEADNSATVQAVTVVIIVAIATAIGAVLAIIVSGDGGFGPIDLIAAIAFGVIGAVIRWVVWALLAVLVGTTILKTEDTDADWGQVARGTGFAQTPGILNVLVFIPFFVGWIIYAAAAIWQLAAMVISLRQTLDYKSTWRAFFVVLIAVIPVLIINWLISLVLPI